MSRGLFHIWTSRLNRGELAVMDALDNGSRADPIDGTPDGFRG